MFLSSYAVWHPKPKYQNQSEHEKKNWPLYGSFFIRSIIVITYNSMQLDLIQKCAESISKVAGVSS